MYSNLDSTENNQAMARGTCTQNWQSLDVWFVMRTLGNKKIYCRGTVCIKNGTR